MGKSSTSLIFDSPSDFRWNNIRFEVSDCPIHNLATYPHNLFVMFPFVITLPSKISNQMAFLAAAFSFRTPIKNHHLRLTKKNHLWRNFVGSLPWNLSCHPLVWNIADLSPRTSLFKVVCRYSTFCRPWARLNVSIATLKVNMIAALLASPRSLPPWSLSCTSFIVFAFCISRSIGYQVAPYLWL
jgi:hypothetical protein